MCRNMPLDAFTADSGLVSASQACARGFFHDVHEILSGQVASQLVFSRCGSGAELMTVIFTLECSLLACLPPTLPSGAGFPVRAVQTAVSHQFVFFCPNCAVWGVCFRVLCKGVVRQRIQVHASVLEVFGLVPNFCARPFSTWYFDIISTCSLSLQSLLAVSVARVRVLYNAWFDTGHISCASFGRNTVWNSTSPSSAVGSGHRQQGHTLAKPQGTTA